MGSLKTARKANSQTNKLQLVKLCIAATLAAVLATPWMSLSQEPPPPPPDFPDLSDAQDPLSEAPPPPPPLEGTEPTAGSSTENAVAPPVQSIQITARSFAVTTLKRSKSLRVYQIEDKSGELPAEGKILLLRRGIIPIMGLKVIKLYPESRSFAAKRMQIYDNRRALDLNENFEALEKTGETVITPPTPQDQADLKEIEGGSPPPPPPPEDLPSQDGMPVDPPPPPPLPPFEDDNAIPPPPDEMDAAAVQPEDALALESHNALIVEDSKPLDPHRHWVSAIVGAMANYDPNGSIIHFATAGARYGITLGKSLFLEGARIQDSLVLEGGVSLYQISGYQESVGDSYTVMPVNGTLRYNFQITEIFGLFLYGGIVKNFVTASTNADPIAASFLNSIVPAVGAGAYLTMGPSWNIRVDAGLDTFSGGLMLRF